MSTDDRGALPKPTAYVMRNEVHALAPSLHWTPQDWHITWEPIPLYGPEAVADLTRQLSEVTRERDALRAERDRDQVTPIGVKNGIETVLGTGTMSPKMKAGEIVRDRFGEPDEDACNDAALALWCCEDLAEWMLKTPNVFRLVVAPQPAEAKETK